MATGAQAKFGSAPAASVTGVAGPDGGTASKPVGLTYVGMAGDGPVEARRWQFDGDRGQPRSCGAAALEWLLERASR